MPTLFIHGAADAVVDARATEYAAGLVPGAETRFYDGVGHMPFAERASEFSTDLAAFEASTKAGS